MIKAILFVFTITYKMNAYWSRIKDKECKILFVIQEFASFIHVMCVTLEFSSVFSFIVDESMHSKTF